MGLIRDSNEFLFIHSIFLSKMTKTRFNLSEESTLELISILRHDLDEWADFYTDHGPFDCDEEDICQESTNQLKTHISWKILNQINASSFFKTQKTAKEWQVKRIKKDIEKALNPWNIDN